MAKRGRPRKDPSLPPLVVTSVVIGKEYRKRLEQILEARGGLSASAWLREKIDHDLKDE